MITSAKSLHDVTAVIKTFERPESLELLVTSIKKHFPELRILVGDDSFEPHPRDSFTQDNVQYIRFPKEIGVSAGRNALLDQVETPYFLLLDDDLELCADTRLDRLRDIVQQHDILARQRAEVLAPLDHLNRRTQQ